MRGNLMMQRLCCLLPAILLLCAPALARAGVAMTDTLSSPLSVSASEIAYNVNDGLGVVATMQVASLAPMAESGSLGSFDFNAAANTGAQTLPFGFSPVPVAPVGSGINPVPGPAPIAGDVNLDNVVDILDWLTVQTNFLSKVNTRQEGDLNGDGFVDLLDWIEVQIHFGDYLIPEPTSLVVFGSCLGFGLLLRRRKVRADKVSKT